ncbi:MAG: DUF1616 domain-containing protein [Candidatus Thermoplasmatota archaeon]|nr:DUF1616 domain-containing protein [Candidatus Thermoplasmatota archaeon]
MVAILQAIVGLLLIFFLPGFTLVKALFAKKEALDKDLGTIYQIILGIGMSLVISIIVGTSLGSIALHEGRGEFTAPNIIIILSLITVIFFGIGIKRTAYPKLTRILCARKK